jgi:mono/diheme cytochrome c family protein
MLIRAVATTIVLLAGIGTAAALDPGAQRGLLFAQTNCASCHAIGPYGDSPLPIAPPFRTFHELYPVEVLEEAFAEGIVTGHPTMPEWQLDAARINDLIDYLKTLDPTG